MKKSNKILPLRTGFPRTIQGHKVPEHWLSFGLSYLEKRYDETESQLVARKEDTERLSALFHAHKRARNELDAIEEEIENYRIIRNGHGVWHCVDDIENFDNGYAYSGPGTVYRNGTTKYDPDLIEVDLSWVGGKKASRRRK